MSLTRNQRRRRAAVLFLIWAVTVFLMVAFAAAFAWALKQVDTPQENSMEYELYMEQEEIREQEEAIQAMLEEPEYTAYNAPRYALSEEELYLLCGVVMAEAGNQPYEGMLAVAQCILNGCERSGLRPAQTVKEYQYTSPAESWTEEVWEAVTAVFYRGETVTEEPILYFYNPDICVSDWHESRRFVIEIGDHRFFAAAEKE